MNFCFCKASLFGWSLLSHSVLFSVSNICSKSLSLSLMASCECRWAASYWPLKIAVQTEAVQLQHVQDEERFREIQVMDHNMFEEKLEDMKVLSS